MDDCNRQCAAAAVAHATPQAVGICMRSKTQAVGSSHSEAASMTEATVAGIKQGCNNDWEALYEKVCALIAFFQRALSLWQWSRCWPIGRMPVDRPEPPPILVKHAQDSTHACSRSQLSLCDVLLLQNLVFEALDDLQERRTCFRGQELTTLASSVLCGKCNRCTKRSSTT